MSLHIRTHSVSHSSPTRPTLHTVVNSSVAYSTQQWPTQYSSSKCYAVAQRPFTNKQNQLACYVLLQYCRLGTVGIYIHCSGRVDLNARCHESYSTVASRRRALGARSECCSYAMAPARPCFSGRWACRLTCLLAFFQLHLAMAADAMRHTTTC